MELNLLIITFSLGSCNNTSESIDEEVYSHSKLKWKKLVYFDFKPIYSEGNTNSFEDEGELSLIKEFLGVVQIEEKNYSFIKETDYTVDDPYLSQTRYYYSRDSLDYTINIEVDTIYSSISNVECDRLEEIFIKNEIIHELVSSSEDDCGFERTTVKKSENFLKSDNNEVLLDVYLGGLKMYIVNNDRVKLVTTPVGNFESKDYSIIARDTLTNERSGLGESTMYYYEDVLIQEFMSIIYKLRYTHKRELVEIEYLEE